VKYVQTALVSDDPSDILLDILAKAGALGEEEDERIGMPDQVLSVGVLACSISPLCKQTTAALSTGPHQYARYSVDRAKNRLALVQRLKTVLEGCTVVLPNPIDSHVAALLSEADVEWKLSGG
jgi:hypothetical protein